MIEKILPILIIILTLSVSGCQTTAGVKAKQDQEEAQEVFSAVAGAVSGKDLSDDEVRDLQERIRTDEEAQSAVQAITESVGGQPPVVKYCPVTGRRYASNMEMCPEHQVELKIVSP